MATARKTTKATAKKATAKKASSRQQFTAEEKAAARDRAAESAVASADHAAVLSKIAELPPGDRQIAQRLHEIITKAAPDLLSRTWYGMPAYVHDGNIVCFFQPASKFKARYATLGFNDSAHLDEGSMWATSFAITKLTRPVETRIRALIRQALD